VLAINLIFEVNYGAFAIFAALLITEIMGSVLLLIAWDETRKRVMDYVVPIWEITGTFGALWVVTGYFAYPALLVPVAAIFGPLLVIFLILFVARNASIVFGEFIVRSRHLDEVRLYKAYAVSTVLLGLVVLVLLSALVGGQGVDLTAGSFSLVDWATPGSLFFIAGTLALAVGLAPAFFDLEPLRRLVLPFTAVGIILSVLSYFAMSSALLTGWMAVPVVLTLLVGLLYLWPKTSRIVANKAVFIAALAVVIFSLQPLIYPKVIGQALSIDAVTTSGVLSSAFLSITVGGWLLLAVMLYLYISIASRGTSGPETAN
jgi:cytochrome d ubiquinol oxidase subunit II